MATISKSITKGDSRLMLPEAGESTRNWEQPQMGRGFLSGMIKMF
jgi:hypothetical protein